MLSIDKARTKKNLLDLVLEMARNTTPTDTLAVRSRTVLVALLAITGSLIAVHLLLRLLLHVLSVPVPDTLVGRFDVDNEISIPTWWSQLILFIPVLLGVALFRISNSRWWLVFSALFLFLSIDEGAMLHEAFITKFREWTTNGSATGLSNHLWLIPVGIILLLMLVPFIRFMRQLPRRTAILLILGMGMFAFGAIVYETFGLIVFSESSPFLYSGINVAIEEGLEMSGACIVVFAALEELRRQSAGFVVTVKR